MHRTHPLRKVAQLFVVFCLFSGMLGFVAEAEAENFIAPETLTNSNVEFVNSQIGGSFEAIFVQDHRAYLGIGKNLVILNINDPRNHFVEGVVRDFPSTIAEVFVDQSQVYVTDRERLWIIDVEQPSQPELLSYFKPAEGCGGVAKKDQFAYVLCRNTVYSLNVSDPTNPIIADSIVIPDSGVWIDRIKISGQFAYIANDDMGLNILDISDPTDIQLAGIGSGTSYGRVIDVFIALKNEKTIAYMVSPEKGVFSADVTNPEAIQLFGSLYSLGWPAQLYVQNDYAYIANQAGGLWIVNIANVNNPATVSSFSTDGMAFNISMDGNLVLINTYSGVLQMVDVSNPANPQETAVYEEPVWINHVIAKGNVAYTAGGKGLGLYDVSDPYNLKLFSQYKTENIASIQIADNRAYLGNLLGKFEIINVQNPRVLEKIGEYRVTNTVNSLPECDPPPPSLPNPPSIPPITDFSIEGQYVYAANSGAGLRFLNISNPSNIMEAGSYKHPDWVFITGIQKIGSIAYVLDAGCWNLPGAFWAIDLSDLAHPAILSSLPLPNWGGDLKIQGDYAYVSLSTNGFYIINIEDPNQPRITATLTGQTEEAYIHENIAYLASGVDGLKVVDISDPTQPTVLGNFALDGAHGVYHQGCVTYMAQWGSGMSLVGYQGDGENCTVSGQVVDAQGNPVSGVNVSLIPNQTVPSVRGITTQGHSVVTNNDGNYSMAGLTTNKYNLTPSLQGKEFIPRRRELKIATDITGQNFVMLETKKIFLPGIQR